jgi:hypothetical protein
MKTMLDVAQYWRWQAASAIVRGGDVTKPPECEAGRTLSACPANAVELLKGLSEAVRSSPCMKTPGVFAWLEEVEDSLKECEGK